MYKVIISPRAIKHLKKLKKKISKEAILHVIEDLEEFPYIGKPLGRELLGRYSYRIGVYRITYRVKEKEKTVEVLTARHRSEAYN